MVCLILIGHCCLGLFLALKPVSILTRDLGSTLSIFAASVIPVTRNGQAMFWSTLRSTITVSRISILCPREFIITALLVSSLAFAIFSSTSTFLYDRAWNCTLHLELSSPQWVISSVTYPSDVASLHVTACFAKPHYHGSCYIALSFLWVLLYSMCFCVWSPCAWSCTL